MIEKIEHFGFVLPLYNYKSLVSIIAIIRPSACLIEGSNGRLSPG